MIEIIAMVMLGQRISRMVKEKGLKSGKYIVFMILLWVGLEILGSSIGMIAFGDRLAGYPLAILGGVTGAIISYHIAKNASPKMSESNDILDANIV